MAAAELGGCGKGGADLYKRVIPIKFVFAIAMWGKHNVVVMW